MKKIKLRIGQNPKCTNKQYHEDRRFQSSSGLKLILKDHTGFHKIYKGRKKKDSKKPTRSMELGSLIHCLLLEPNELHKQFAIYPGKVRRGKSYNVFKARRPNREVITANVLFRAKGLIKKLTKSSRIRNILKNGKPEVTACQIVGGVRCKARFDYIDIRNGKIIDIKTTRRPRGHERKLADEASDDIGALWFEWFDTRKFGYWLSAALYLEIAKITYGKDFEFIIVALSTKDGSSHLHCSHFSQAALKRGKEQLEMALEKYRLYYQGKNAKPHRALLGLL